MTDNEMNAGQRMPEQSVDGYTEQQLRKGIAVIGIAGRFPGADNVTQYWQNIADGVNCIREIPPQRWSWQEYFGDPKKEANKTNVKWGGFINDMDKFDPLFFNISPKEAAYMDPQHRIFLQAVWHAIEDAGYRVSDFSGSKMGVYAGVSKNDYSELMRATHQPITPFISTGTVHSILTNRVSFLFDFRGRSEAVDTACSSSLVSLHNAIRDIHNGECDTAIVGGVNALLAPTMYISHAKSGMLSVDGQCKTFDADANGYVRSEGVGVLLLKPLAKALADNDQIYTVIKGSAINHGGRANFLTSPRTEAQAEVIGAALKDADVTPDSIQYVEAHGTGTPMGDPIEINGLKMAFSEAGQKQQKSCALSSAKSNVGHLESAAGIAAIIRVIMAMKHQTIPGLGNFNRINPYIELEDSPFYLATEPLVWKKGQQPRRAGVSSFGMGGVNAHVILEEPPQRKAPANSPYREFMAPLSAKKGQLKILVEELLARLDGEPQMKPQRLADICYTLQVGRDEHDERLALVFTSQTQWQQQLSAYLADCENGSITKITGSYYHRVVMKKGQRQKQINASPQPLNDIAAQWVQGAAVEWQSYYQDATPQRVSLGQYPFVKKTCWFENQTETVAQTTVVQQPLLRPYSQNGTVILAQDDFYLADHVVQGTPILPGVAYLELARHAAQQAKAQPLSGFKDI
ncbi:MAG: acyl transferase domain-containing protein, partial [Alteromonadaceae bacterium]